VTCIIYDNDKRYQLDATIVIYHHKYRYMFRASLCPSSGVQVVCCCIWCSAHNLYSCRWAYRCPKHVEIFMMINHNWCIK